MAVYRECKSCGDIHQVDRWPHNCMPPAPNRSDLASPYIISDYLGGINGLMHHAAGRMIDSKSTFRRTTREYGCVEIGNESGTAKTRPNVQIKPEVIESGVNDALHQLGISSECDTGKLDYGTG